LGHVTRLGKARGPAINSLRRTTRSQNFYGRAWNELVNNLDKAKLAEFFSISMSISNHPTLG
jgi:hypothetical protein